MLVEDQIQEKREDESAAPHWGTGEHRKKRTGKSCGRRSSLQLKADQFDVKEKHPSVLFFPSVLPSRRAAGSEGPFD